MILFMGGSFRPSFHLVVADHFKRSVSKGVSQKMVTATRQSTPLSNLHSLNRHRFVYMHPRGRINGGGGPFSLSGRSLLLIVG